MKNKIQIFRFIIQICSMAGLIFPFLPHPDIVGNYLFLTSIIFGVFFCGWICPFGTIQDWINILAKKLKIPQFTMPQKLQKYLQFTRYIFAIIGSVGITFSFLNTRYYFNHNLLNRMLTFSSAITLLIFILISLFFKRPFCNYFCIKGAIDGAISVFRLFGIKKDNNVLETARCIFYSQVYDWELHLWHRIELNGEDIDIDPTYNHHVWFAACSYKLADLCNDPEIKRIIIDFG